jgi:tRNA U55 pseudouridine synthase TruB
MTQLKRLGVGPFDVADAISPDRLTPATINDVLQPALKIVSHLRQRNLSTEEVIAVRRGQSIGDVSRSTNAHPDCINEPVDHRIALVGPQGSLLGIGELDIIAHRLHPRIVFPD